MSSQEQRDRDFHRAQALYDAMDPPWTDAIEDVDCIECGQPLSPDELDDLEAGRGFREDDDDLRAQAVCRKCTPCEDPSGDCRGDDGLMCSACENAGRAPYMEKGRV